MAAGTGIGSELRVSDWVRLHEKGGKRHEMPVHHKLEASSPSNPITIP
jgi:hypothetical protein